MFFPCIPTKPETWRLARTLPSNPCPFPASRFVLQVSGLRASWNLSRNCWSVIKLRVLNLIFSPSKVYYMGRKAGEREVLSVLKNEAWIKWMDPLIGNFMRSRTKVRGTWKGERTECFRILISSYGWITFKELSREWRIQSLCLIEFTFRFSKTGEETFLPYIFRTEESDAVGLQVEFQRFQLQVAQSALRGMTWCLRTRKFVFQYYSQTSIDSSNHLLVLYLRLLVVVPEFFPGTPNIQFIGGNGGIRRTSRRWIFLWRETPGGWRLPFIQKIIARTFWWWGLCPSGIFGPHLVRNPVRWGSSLNDDIDGTRALTLLTNVERLMLIVVTWKERFC